MFLEQCVDWLEWCSAQSKPLCLFPIYRARTVYTVNSSFSECAHTEQTARGPWGAIRWIWQKVYSVKAYSQLRAKLLLTPSALWVNDESCLISKWKWDSHSQEGLWEVGHPFHDVDNNQWTVDSMSALALPGLRWFKQYMAHVDPFSTHRVQIYMWKW